MRLDGNVVSFDAIIHEPKYWTNYRFDNAGTEWKVKDHQNHYNSSRGQHVPKFCIKFYGNLSRHFTLNHKRRPHSHAESLGFIIWESWMSVQNFMAIHHIVVEIFQPRPKWWTDRNSASMANTFVIRQNGDKWKLLSISWLRSHRFITCQEKCGSAGWDGGNPAVWQVDRLTSCAPGGFLPTAVPRSGWSKSRKTPSPPCYLIIATSHTGTLCTLCSSAAKYKTTGRDAVYIIRDSCFFFPCGLWDNFMFKKSAINHSYSAENRKHAWITGSIWQWNCAARWCHLFFRTGIYSHLTVLEVPPAEHKGGPHKTSNQL